MVPDSDSTEKDESLSLKAVVDIVSRLFSFLFERRNRLKNGFLIKSDCQWCTFVEMYASELTLYSERRRSSQTRQCAEMR